jgi:hypothetical protein
MKGNPFTLTRISLQMINLKLYLKVIKKLKIKLRAMYKSI